MDPNNMNPTYKRALLNQNIFQSRFGNYKMLPMIQNKKNKYLQKFKPGGIVSVCDVKVFNKNPIDILDALMQKGTQNLMKQEIPVVFQTIGSDFNGSNLESGEGLRDQLFVLRTNFSAVFRLNNPFPLKDTECAYIPLTTVIRDKMGQFLTYDKVFGYSLILACPISQPDLIDEERMTTKDYMTTLSIVETIFQTAIACGHKILVLTPFGLEDEDENPAEDIVKIYNFCIYKYGHKFKNIIVSVPEYFPKSVYELFDEELVKPQELTKAIDSKYESEKMHAHLQSL